MAKDSKGHGSNAKGARPDHALDTVHKAGERLRQTAVKYPGAKLLYDRAIKKNDKMEATAAKRVSERGPVPQKGKPPAKKGR